MAACTNERCHIQAPVPRTGPDSPADRTTARSPIATPSEPATPRIRPSQLATQTKPRTMPSRPPSTAATSTSRPWRTPSTNPPPGRVLPAQSPAPGPAPAPAPTPSPAPRAPSDGLPTRRSRAAKVRTDAPPPHATAAPLSPPRTWVTRPQTGARRTRADTHRREPIQRPAVTSNCEAIQVQYPMKKLPCRIMSPTTMAMLPRISSSIPTTRR